MGYWLYVYRLSLGGLYDVKLHHNNLESLLEYSLQLVKISDVVQIQITNGDDYNVFLWNSKEGITIPEDVFAEKFQSIRFRYSSMMLDDILPLLKKDRLDTNDYTS